MRIAGALGLALLAACGGSGSGEMPMSAPVSAAAPPIDREIPARLETATFALG